MTRNNRQFTVFFTLLTLLLLSFDSFAGNAISPSDQAILDKADIPLYPGMQYTNGSLGGMMGVRFASADPTQKIRAWYREKFPQWALNDQYGSWILYDGKPGGGPMAYMNEKQVMIVENKELPQWFNLPPSMTTEVVIVVPSDQ